MVALYHLTSPLSLLTSNQILVIEIVIHNGRAAVYKGILFAREALITNIIRALTGTQEQRELIKAG
jgi:hypothetical protein